MRVCVKFKFKDDSGTSINNPLSVSVLCMFRVVKWNGKGGNKSV